jgi:hypothetical protein
MNRHAPIAAAAGPGTIRTTSKLIPVNGRRIRLQPNFR